MVKNSTYLFILLGLFLFSLGSCDKEKNDIKDADFIGQWKVDAKVERYQGDDYDQQFADAIANINDSDPRVKFDANGEGTFTDEGRTDPMHWVYVPDRERMYMYIDKDSISGGSISFKVDMVKDNSQVWTDEAYFDPYRYVYTWNLERD